jgi:phosphoribosyl 1,2-cyclic phosphodiesterase
MSLSVRFWGVRGSVPCASPQYMRYGGNTSTIEVTAGASTIILDAGTGLRELGESLLERNIKQATLLLTHVHWDHICGFPFFAPAYHPQMRLAIRAAHLAPQGGVREVLSGHLTEPTFPVPLSAMRAKLEFLDFNAGESFELEPSVVVHTASLRHPNGATGYRIEHAGRALCYVTDTEHQPGLPDKAILELIGGADLVIYDSTYTDEEFDAKVGWGHSSWQEGVRLCQAAHAKRLAIFHHDPSHDDAFMDRIAIEAAEMWPHSVVAVEGSTFEL